MKLILICDLIPNLSATSLACSGVIAISPLGTLTPYLLKIPMLRCSCRDRCLLHSTAGRLVSCTVDRKYIIYMFSGLKTPYSIDYLASIAAKVEEINYSRQIVMQLLCKIIYGKI